MATPIFQPGGFWARAVAAWLDGFVLSFVYAGVNIATGLNLFTDDPDLKILAITIVIGWLYEAGLTSTERGATLGKMAVGLRVVTEAGERLSFLRSTGRYFAKMVSALTVVGLVMVAFTERKRGLHDMMAGTLVVKVEEPTPPPFTSP